mgnify:CR=1 FL=1
MTDLSDEQTSPSAPLAPSIVQEREVLLVRPGEKFPVVEVGRPLEIKAVEGVEGLEKELLTLEKSVVHRGEVLVESPEMREPKIVLPMDRTTYLNPKNWHKPVTSALRWLLTWAQRIVKMHPGRTTFQEN